MTAGRPRKADAGLLYSFAHQFYWDFRRIDEGTLKIFFDQKKFETLRKEAEVATLTDEQLQKLERQLDYEIQSGRITAEDRERLRTQFVQGELFMTRYTGVNEAAEESRKLVPVKGERDTIEELLNATTPEQIIQICDDAFTTRTIETPLGPKEIRVPQWPIDSGSPFPRYLRQHAAEFIAAKNDLRFPRSGRKTSRLKQFWFLSRALAGAMYGIKTRTAINLVGSMTPDDLMEFSRGGKRKRKTKKRRRS